MRRHQGVDDGAAPPDYSSAMAALRSSIWYRLGILAGRIVLADFAIWFAVSAVAAQLGASDATLRQIGGYGISVFLLMTAFAAMIAIPSFRDRRRYERVFGIRFFDTTWRNTQLITALRDTFTMWPLLRRSK
jgi:hypothetical protein